MLQVNFSNQSIEELNRLDQLVQMRLVDQLSSLNAEYLIKQAPEIGRFQREGQMFYRVRIGEHRIYFELKEPNTLFCHYLLPQHSLRDFIFRFKLPVSDEVMAEQHPSFWQYLESLKK